MNINQFKELLSFNGLNPEDCEITTTGNLTTAVPKSLVWLPFHPSNQTMQILRVAVVGEE